MTMRETEPIRLPTWKTALRDYERAMGRYTQNPTLGATAFLDRARLRLDAEVRTGGRFPLGLVAMSADAIGILKETATIPQQYLIRHRNGDYGALGEEDGADNEYAIPREYRVRLVYATDAGALEVVTVGNRSHTTIDIVKAGRENPIR